MNAQREMTLTEWVGRLPSIHLARRQLEQLQSRMATAEELLQAAKCPSCPGTGVVDPGNGEMEQCQWCSRRNSLLSGQQEGRR